MVDRLASDGGPPSVYGDGLAGNEMPCVACQKQRRANEIIGYAPPVHGLSGLLPIRHLWRGEHVDGQIAHEISGRDGIDAALTQITGLDVCKAEPVAIRIEEV